MKLFWAVLMIATAAAAGAQPLTIESPAVRDVWGLVEGQAVSPETLRIVSEQQGAVVYRHSRLPLEIAAQLRAWGDTGVITRDLALVNRGSDVVHIERLPSLHWRLPKGEYTLTYLYGGWGQERQVGTEKIGAGRRAFVSDRGRSTALYSPWFYLHNDTSGIGYLGQLAWSGNWEMTFERPPGASNSPLSDQELTVELGMVFDFGGALALDPGARFELPRVAMTSITGDLDDAANRMHRFQRQYVFAHNKANEPPLVQFNSWYVFFDKVNATNLLRCADVAAEIGAEVFVLDSGWYSTGDWQQTLGDWTVTREKFPNGLEPVSEYVRRKGMRFGIWVEIENAGPQSRVFREHPDWFFHYDGVPLAKGKRYHLNFGKPEVRAWAKAVVDRLVSDYWLGWIKIDYNVDEGNMFDPSRFGRRGDVLHNHLRGYYQWLDDIRTAHPDLIIENCSSGGLRFDTGIMAHTHSNWLSDVVEPRPSVQLGYGCTVEFAPEVCNHWMVGDKENGIVDLNSPSEWWDFMFRVPMNGQFGISSRVFDWNDALRKRAAENVALYKRLRPTIANADVYHLTPPPSHNRPEGWMALEYALPDRSRAVVMAYRLEGPGDTRTFRLRGLDPSRNYRVNGDSISGKTLADVGLKLTIGTEWRSAAVEIQAE